MGDREHDNIAGVAEVGRRSRTAETLAKALESLGPVDQLDPAFAHLFRSPRHLVAPGFGGLLVFALEAGQQLARKVGALIDWAPEGGA